MQAYEFTDTLIMILKKNERQITFLHIYHHATTFFPCWCASTSTGRRSEDASMQYSKEALSCCLSL